MPSNTAPGFFVGDAKVTTAIGTSTDIGYSVTFQPDGKILVARISSNDTNNESRASSVNSSAQGPGTITFEPDAVTLTRDSLDWADGNDIRVVDGLKSIVNDGRT